MTKEQLQTDVVLTALELDKQQIAKRCKLDRSTVSRTLSGERTSEQTLDKIADVVREAFKASIQNANPV